MQLNKDSLRNEFNRPQSKNASSNQIFSWLKTYTDDVDILQDFDYSGVAEVTINILFYYTHVNMFGLLR